MDGWKKLLAYSTLEGVHRCTPEKQKQNSTVGSAGELLYGEYKKQKQFALQRDVFPNLLSPLMTTV